jgi:Xaa-Pro aminopeptidase
MRSQKSILCMQRLFTFYFFLDLFLLFLYEICIQVLKGEEWDEIKASERAAAIRKEMPLNQGPSFESVSASGINSALPHYEATDVTNSKINQSAVYTLDSGGHYLGKCKIFIRRVFTKTFSKSRWDN